MHEENRAIVPDGIPKIRSEIFWEHFDGETVVVNMDRGKYFAFDKTAASIWDLLAVDTDPEQIAAALARKYGIDVSRTRTDVLTFIADLRTKGLIEFVTNGIDHLSARKTLPDLVSLPYATTRTKPIATGKVDEQVGGVRKYLLFVEAYALLFCIDVALNLIGFHGLWRRLDKRRSVACVDAAAPQVVRALSKIALSAFRWYRPGVACMHRALATFWFLKRRGIAVDLCLGIRTNPFSSHAWVECEDLVLDDFPEVKSWFRTIAKVSSYERDLLHSSLGPTTC